MTPRVLLAVCVCAAVSVGTATAAAEPRLALVDPSPVTLVGTGFAAHERVVVTVRAPSLLVVRTVRAGESGRFRASVPSLRLVGRLRCAQGVTVTVRRAAGQLLLWRPPRLPDCPAPLPVRPA